MGRHFTPDLPEKNQNPALTELFEKQNHIYCMAMKEILELNGGYTPPSYQQVISETKGMKKKRYQRAYDNIVNKRILFSDQQARVNFFVKLEKWPTSKIEKGKPPRGIQFRSYEYLLALKRSMTPLVNCTKADITFDHKPEFNPSITYTKNNTPQVIARNFVEAWMRYKQPVAICLDHSCFDGHYSTELLTAEIKRYSKITALRRSSLLMRLLAKMKVNKGFSMGGIKYRVEAKRCSGEYTTSHGNGETNYLMIRSVLLLLGVKDFVIFVNGDDSVIICDFEDMDIIVNNLALFRNFNMVTEIEQIAHTIEEITFCQSSPVNVNGTYTMIRKPLRVMERLCYSSTNWSPVLFKFMVSVGLCELSMNKGVPILQDLAIWLIRRGGCNRPLTTYKTEHYDAQARLEVLDISLTTRESFQQAFGISISEQLSIEKSLRDDLNDHPDHIELLLKILNHKLY